MGKHLTTILTKMFDVVGDKFDENRIKSDRWFMANQWTGIQEEEFKDWMRAYLWDNYKDAKKELDHLRKNKKNIREQVEWFVFMYGWQYKEDENGY